MYGLLTGGRRVVDWLSVVGWQYSCIRRPLSPLQTVASYQRRDLNAWNKNFVLSRGHQRIRESTQYNYATKWAMAFPDLYRKRSCFDSSSVASFLPWRSPRLFQPLLRQDVGLSAQLSAQPGFLGIRWRETAAAAECLRALVRTAALNFSTHARSIRTKAELICCTTCRYILVHRGKREMRLWKPSLLKHHGIKYRKLRRV